MQFNSEALLTTIKTKNEALKVLRKELKQIGFKLSFKLSSYDDFYMQLDDEASRVYLYFQEKQINVRFRSQIRDETLQQCFYREQAIFLALAYVAEQAAVERIDLHMYSPLSTMYMDDYTFVYQKEVKVKQQRLHHFILSLKEHIIDDTQIGFHQLSITEKKNYELIFIHKVSEKTCTFLLDYDEVAGMYWVNNEKKTEKEIEEMLKKWIDRTMKATRIKMLVEPTVQIAYLVNRGFTKRQAKKLVEHLDFQTIEQLGVQKTSEIDLFLQQEKMITHYRCNVLYLTNGGFMISQPYYTFYYATEEALLCEQKKLQAAFIQQETKKFCEQLAQLKQKDSE